MALSQQSEQQRLEFIYLPTEIRLIIYRFLLGHWRDESCLSLDGFLIPTCRLPSGERAEIPTALLSTCKVIHGEVIGVLYGENNFSTTVIPQYPTVDWRAYGWPEMRLDRIHKLHILIEFRFSCSTQIERDSFKFLKDFKSLRFLSVAVEDDYSCRNRRFTGWAPGTTMWKQNLQFVQTMNMLRASIPPTVKKLVWNGHKCQQCDDQGSKFPGRKIPRLGGWFLREVFRDIREVVKTPSIQSRLPSVLRPATESSTETDIVESYYESIDA
ncbi:hypothetical protein NA57DRAFT_80064 [Rhizodiscina lignyota]|uniref:Uncharacterized protein n=1 Tax=Rhizodiscina lignyota TaxID=1504668 RepID=A0A9P4I4C5_9PEZI|nr:hypothetical protein NA57DRAFT_80064 [Rhizodiscina lignyota]